MLRPLTLSSIQLAAGSYLKNPKDSPEQNQRGSQKKILLGKAVHNQVHSFREVYRAPGFPRCTSYKKKQAKAEALTCLFARPVLY